MKIIKICDFITKYSIYALIFLVPIFFLPKTIDVLDFNKQALLLVLVFISLFSFMLKTLVVGRIEIKKNPLNIVAGVLFLSYIFSTIFSVYRHGSFWGVPQQTSESVVAIICFLLFYFLVSNVFSKKEILTSIIILSFSATIAEFFGVLQLCGIFILPFDFAKSSAFNLLGSVGSLGIFTAVLFPLAIMLLIIVKKWWRIIFAIEIILSAAIFFLIGYPVIWWIVIIGSALVLMMGTIKSSLFDGRWMVLPMFFLAVSLFFVLVNPQINWLPEKPNEIFLSQGAGFNVALQTIKEKPIFGSGLGTFSYDFSKFKNPDFSKSALWNVTFNKSSSRILNNLATTGVVGFLAILALIITPLFYGIKFFIFRKKYAVDDLANKTYDILLLGLLIGLVELGVSQLLYNSSVVIDFVLFFMIAVVSGLVFSGKKEYELKSSSLFTLATTFVFTLVFIFGLGILILNGQRYLAEVNYYKALSFYQAGQKIDGLRKLEVAASINPSSDLYFRQLSQAYLLSLQEELQNNKSENPTDEEKAKVQTLVANSVNAGKIATDINPNDSNNWSSRGYVYQSLINILSDASNWAVASYDQALKLDPNNPYLFFQEGNIYLTNAIGLATDKAEQKNQLLAKAQEQLEKAVALNPNYSNALYSLGIVYDSLGQKTKSIDAFTRLQQLNPQNTDIPKILANLRAGRSALQSATIPTEAPSNGDNNPIK